MMLTLKRFIAALCLSLSSATLAASTTAQLTEWQKALGGKHGDNPTPAFEQIEAHAMDDVAVIPMLIEAVARQNQIPGGGVVTTVGARACGLLGQITQYPVFLNIACHKVNLIEAQKVWRSWYEPRKNWSLQRIRDNSTEKRQRLLRSKRPNEALRGTIAALAFGLDDADVQKALQRFTGDLRASAIKKPKGMALVTLRNDGKSAAMYAINPSETCWQDPPPPPANDGKATVAVPRGCPAISPSFPSYEYAAMLAPGASRTFTVRAQGTEFSVTDQLRKKEIVGTLAN